MLWVEAIAPIMDLVAWEFEDSEALLPVVKAASSSANPAAGAVLARFTSTANGGWQLLNAAITLVNQTRKADPTDPAAWTALKRAFDVPGRLGHDLSRFPAARLVTAVLDASVAVLPAVQAALETAELQTALAYLLRPSRSALSGAINQQMDERGRRAEVAGHLWKAVGRRAYDPSCPALRLLLRSFPTEAFWLALWDIVPEAPDSMVRFWLDLHREVSRQHFARPGPGVQALARGLGHQEA